MTSTNLPRSSRRLLFALVLVLAASATMARAAEPERTVLVVRAEVHRTYDDRVVVSVPIAPADEKLLVARGFHRCKRTTGDQESATVCNGRAYYEYRIEDRPLVLELLRAAHGQSIVLDVARTPAGKMTVVDAHRAP